MRLKHILERLSLTAWIRLIYERIHLTRFTALFLLIALGHCFAQIGLQSAGLAFNRQSCRTIGDILDTSGEPRVFASVSGDVLSICKKKGGCFPITGPDAFTDLGMIFGSVNGSASSSAVKSRGLAVSVPNKVEESEDELDEESDDESDVGSDSDSDAGSDVGNLDDVDDEPDSQTQTTGGQSDGQKKTDDDDDDDDDDEQDEEDGDKDDKNNSANAESNPGNNGGSNVQITSKSINGPTGLPLGCIAGLNWPEIAMNDARREDITFLGAQIWLFVISFVTVLNESIPHLMTALIAHGLTVAWGVFQVSRTDHNKFVYNSLVVGELCNGRDLLPEFWSIRMNFFVPILVMNVVVFVLLLGISYKLFKPYSQRTLQRVGASNIMMKRYFVILLFSVFLQLSAFFTLVSSAIWLDMLSDAVLAQFTNFLTGYRVIFIIVSILALPWVIIGWASFRRESRLWAHVFLLLGLGITVATSSMFASKAYNRLFVTFPFFATVSVAAYVIVVCTNVLAVLCRCNFGKGLTQCLTTEKNFDDASFVPVVVPTKQQRRSRLASVIFPDKPTAIVAFHAGIQEEYAQAYANVKASNIGQTAESANDGDEKMKDEGYLDPLSTSPNHRTSSFLGWAARSLRTASDIMSVSIMSPRTPVHKSLRSRFSTSTTSTALSSSTKNSATPSTKSGASSRRDMEYAVPALPTFLAPKAGLKVAPLRAEPELASTPAPMPPSESIPSMPAPAIVATPAYNKRVSPSISLVSTTMPMPTIRPPGLEIEGAKDQGRVQVQRSLSSSSNATGRGSAPKARVRPPALNLGTTSNLSISAPNPAFLESHWSPTTITTSTGSVNDWGSASEGTSTRMSTSTAGYGRGGGRVYEAQLGPRRIVFGYGPSKIAAPGRMVGSLPANPRDLVGQRGGEV